MFKYDPPDDQDLSDPPEEMRLTLAEPWEDDLTPDPTDEEWERLADAVDSGQFGPETEVEL